MAQLVITDVLAAGSSAKLVITDVVATTTPSAQLVITDVFAGSIQSQVVITDVLATSVVQVSEVANIPSQSVDAFATVSITATSIDPANPATSYSFTQTAGPTVAFTQTGATIQFQAPATYAGATISFLVQAHKSGLTSTGKTASVTVSPWDKFIWTGTKWLPYGAVSIPVKTGTLPKQ
jgi:hypothetical protein